MPPHGSYPAVQGSASERPSPEQRGPVPPKVHPHSQEGVEERGPESGEPCSAAKLQVFPQAYIVYLFYLIELRLYGHQPLEDFRTRP